MKKKLIHVALLLIVSCVSLYAEHRSAKTVFKKWFDYQTVYKDRSLTELNKSIDWQKIAKQYKKHKDDVQGYEPFLQSAFDPDVISNGATGSRRATENLKNIRMWLDKNPGKFLKFFEETSVVDEAMNRQEEELHFNDVIDKNKALLRILLCCDNERTCDEYHFACVNRLFEYFFDSRNHDKFIDLLNDKSRHQVARFCYSTLWYNLVGDGWKHWHEDCLKALAKKGDTVVYIAGGNDIHEPLRYGIYSMKIIDPFLPSQNDYYAEDVEWLLDSGTEDHGIGDTFDVTDVHGKKLMIKRTGYSENGTFTAPLSTGKTIELPQSETTWAVIDEASSKKLGEIVFERRYAAQRDFDVKPKSSILASYNEFYFVGAQPHLGGWGMNVEKFDKNIQVYVKQLRKPVSKKVMQNLYATDNVDFHFISLGSCPT